VALPVGAVPVTQIAAAMLAMVAKNPAVEVVVAADLPAEGFAGPIVRLAPATFAARALAQSESTPIWRKLEMHRSKNVARQKE
jgi:hypothetical protein